MNRCYNTFTERRDPNWLEASIALRSIGLDQNQGVVEAAAAALQCCKKYKNCCRLTKAFATNGFIGLFLIDLHNKQQHAPALESLCLWLSEQQIEYMYNWLCMQSGIMQKAYAMVDSDSPF